MTTVPTEVEEAARLDGASRTGNSYTIVLSMRDRVILMMLIVRFAQTGYERPRAQVLVSSDGLRTIPLGLPDLFGEFSAEYTKLFAALVLASLPVLTIYLVFSKYVIEGTTAGAVNG